MNSHIYRAKSMEMTAFLSNLQRTMIIVLYSVIKNKKRILDHMNTIPADLGAAGKAIYERPHGAVGKQNALSRTCGISERWRQVGELDCVSGQ